MSAPFYFSEVAGQPVLMSVVPASIYFVELRFVIEARLDVVPGETMHIRDFSRPSWGGTRHRQNFPVGTVHPSCIPHHVSGRHLSYPARRKRWIPSTCTVR